jgi:hypothetical protein
MSDPQHALVDFVALAAVQTNEQKILASSLRIEELLTKLVDASSWTPRTTSHTALAAKRK